ncbi:metallophosphoesterase family protein [Pseudalkalibacillus caeni]|nr:DNA repair exonuclease [Pseudalkalibacillus caeni]
MSKLTFIHTADLHLDSPFKGLHSLPSSIYERMKESTFHSLHNIVSLAVEKKVDFVLIAGDLFHSEERSLRAQIKLHNELIRLKDHHIDCFIIHGNHDPLDGYWVNLEWPENVHIFGEETSFKPYYKNGKLMAHLYGFSYPTKRVTDNRTQEYVKKEGPDFHIGMLHGNVQGASDHEAYAPFKVEQLLEKQFDYWALGHIHKRQVLTSEPPILYPGNIQGLSKKETGEKGCYLVELEKKRTRLTFQNTAEIIWKKVEVPIDGLTSFSELYSCCEEVIEGIRSDHYGVMATLMFTGSGTMDDFLQNDQEIEDLIVSLRDGEERKKDFIWIAEWKVETNPDWDREELKHSELFAGDIVRLSEQYEDKDIDEALNPLFHHRRARHFISKLSTSEKQELIRDAEKLLLNSLLKERT